MKMAGMQTILLILFSTVEITVLHTWSNAIALYESYLYIKIEQRLCKQNGALLKNLTLLKKASYIKTETKTKTNILGKF